MDVLIHIQAFEYLTGLKMFTPYISMMAVARQYHQDIFSCSQFVTAAAAALLHQLLSWDQSPFYDLFSRKISQKKIEFNALFFQENE